jgi:hypothetical protein
MTLPENIFAEALERLDRGETPTQIAASYSDYQQELEGLLSVAEMGMNIPKLVPPTPYKRHLFAEKAVTTSGALVQFLMFARVAVIPISLVIALLGGRAVVDATEDSLPGDTLYNLKRATEEARLTITRDQSKIATIHVELMQKRLAEVKQAASNGDEASEAAAITALKSQTEKTFAEAAPLATANAISKQDSTLLDSLVAINKEQKDVLEDVSESEGNEDAKTVAITALEDNKKNDFTLAKIIATVNDQALVDLPNKISVTGQITYHVGSKVIVEKNTFTIDKETKFQDIDGGAVSEPEDLTGRVTVTGTRLENGTLLAKQILMLPADTGEVKGETTTTTTTTTTTKPAPTTIEPAPTTEPVQVQPKATGSYIVEPSSQQYTP